MENIKFDCTEPLNTVDKLKNVLAEVCIAIGKNAYIKEKYSTAIQDPLVYEIIEQNRLLSQALFLLTRTMQDYLDEVFASEDEDLSSGAL